MRLTHRFLTVALFTAVAAASAAGALTNVLDPLVAEMRLREAGLEDATDATSIRQRRAVRRSIDVIAASETLSGDARALAQAAPLLVRTFPGEFAAPEFAADLSDFVGDAYQRLSDEVFRRRDDLAARIEGLPAPTAARARRWLDRADVLVWRPFRERSFRTQALAFARAALVIERGMAAAEEDPIK